MEALLSGRVTKYAHILRSPNENNSKYIEGHTFTMDTKRVHCVSSLETSLANVQFYLLSYTLGFYSGFAKGSHPCGLRSACISTVLPHLPPAWTLLSFRMSLFQVSFVTQMASELENQKSIWFFGFFFNEMIYTLTSRYQKWEYTVVHFSCYALCLLANQLTEDIGTA